jgi:hypothetical protein
LATLSNETQAQTPFKNHLSDPKKSDCHAPSSVAFISLFMCRFAIDSKGI